MLIVLYCIVYCIWLLSLVCKAHRELVNNYYALYKSQLLLLLKDDEKTPSTCILQSFFGIFLILCVNPGFSQSPGSSARHNSAAKFALHLELSISKGKHSKDSDSVIIVLILYTNQSSGLMWNKGDHKKLVNTTSFEQGSYACRICMHCGPIEHNSIC